ncbi:hypothetical protein AAHE18_11G219100 [Arachis hypogaea]
MFWLSACFVIIRTYMAPQPTKTLSLFNSISNFNHLFLFHDGSFLLLCRHCCSSVTWHYRFIPALFFPNPNSPSFPNPPPSKASFGITWHFCPKKKKSTK